MDETTNNIKNDVAGVTPGTLPAKPLQSGLPGEEKIFEYEQKLNSLHAELTMLDKNRLALSREIEEEALAVVGAEKALLPILKEETSITEALKEAGVKERQATDLTERRTHEKERWAYIEQWYAVEQKKWQKQEVLGQLRGNLTAHRKDHDALTEKESTLRKEIEDVEVAEEREKLNILLNTIVANRIDTENKLYALDDSRKKTLAEFEAVQQKESGLENKGSELESMLQSVHSMNEERSLGEERYALEKERHEVEMARWVIEDQMTEIGGSIVESTKFLTELKQKEAALLEKLEMLNKKTAGAPPPTAPSVSAQPNE